MLCLWVCVYIHIYEYACIYFLTSSTEEPGTNKSPVEIRILRIQNLVDKYFSLKETTISQRIIDSKAGSVKEQHGSGKFSCTRNKEIFKE